MIAYNPVGNFILRDFHHAVNNLPYDAFQPDIDNISGTLSPSLNPHFSHSVAEHALTASMINDQIQ